MKIKTLRDSFFYGVDKLLPMWMRRLPYLAALKNTQLDLHGQYGISVWARNTFKSGDFVFGVSDLDLTVVIESKCELKTEWLEILHRNKKRYPFIGEINFYFLEKTPVYLSSLNSYEGMRDPELMQLIPGRVKFDRIDKIVFLLRMLFSDREKLLSFPELRQKKWKSHFSLLGMSSSGIENFDTISEKIIQLLHDEPEIRNHILSVLDFMKTNTLTDKSIFSSELPLTWKFLFPHKYLWFLSKSEREEVPESMSSFLIQICLRQIDWEIWGLMSQLPYSKGLSYNLNIHMRRLRRVVELIDPKNKSIQRIDYFLQDLIKFEEVWSTPE